MSILVIGPSEKAAIEAAIVMARLNPTPLETVNAHGRNHTKQLMLADIPQETREKLRPRSQQVILGTYRAAFSFENQPGGLCRHLSVSSPHAGKVPIPEVMGIIAVAFGFSGWPLLKREGMVWTEEFLPGHMAINVLELDHE
jgi:hypothetical protein